MFLSGNIHLLQLLKLILNEYKPLTQLLLLGISMAYVAVCNGFGISAQTPFGTFWSEKRETQPYLQTKKKPQPKRKSRSVFEGSVNGFVS